MNSTIQNAFFLFFGEGGREGGGVLLGVNSTPPEGIGYLFCTYKLLLGGIVLEVEKLGVIGTQNSTSPVPSTTEFE